MRRRGRGAVLPYVVALGFAGFAMFLGIFVAATTGALLTTIGFHPGTIAAGLGIVPALVGVIGLGRHLAGF